MHESDEEQRSKALYCAVRAFQAALGIQGADVTDYLPSSICWTKLSTSTATASRQAFSIR
jgi:hypothetical protein